MARSRYLPDRGLTARMVFTMFLLGLLFVVLGAVLIRYLGALDDPTGTSKDDISLELERMASSNDVELEMQRLKGEVGAGTAPREIEGQADSTSTAAPAKAEEEKA